MAKLKEFQELALNNTNTKHKALYWEMGLGKTYGGAEQAIRYGDKIIIVVCQKSKLDDWMDHFEINYPYVDIYDLTVSKYLDHFMNDRNPDNVSIGFINYELIWHREEIKNLKDFTLVLDESSEIQHESTAKCKFIIGDAKHKYLNNLKSNHNILLSGTPVSGKYENLWSQIRLLGWMIPKTTFEKSYCVKEYKKDWKGDLILSAKGFPVKEIVGYKNEEHLKRQLRLLGASFIKTEEVIELPPQTEIKVNIEVSKEYKQFIKNDVVTVDGQTLVGDMLTKKYLYSRYLCGALNKKKLEALKDLINSTNDRLIIFYSFDIELEKIKSVIPSDRPISYCNGHIKDNEAYLKCDKSIYLIQYQSGSRGLNLQLCNKIIYFSMTNVCEFWQQSMKRTHRMGQERPCFNYYLLCGNEYHMLDVLKTGKDYTDDLYKEDLNYELRRNNG